MKLPNGASILIGVVLVAALTALAGELPNSATGWLPVAGAAVLMGIAKAVQVWVDAQNVAAMDLRELTLAQAANDDWKPPERPSVTRQFFIG